MQYPPRSGLKFLPFLLLDTFPLPSFPSDPPYLLNPFLSAERRVESNRASLWKTRVLCGL